VTVTPGDNELRRLFERLPRAAAPDIPVEKLVARLRAARLRRIALSGLAAAIGGLLVALAFRKPEPSPPVLLPLRVVNLPEPRLEEEPLTPGEPPEVSLP